MVAQVTKEGIGLGGLFDGLKINVDSYSKLIDSFKQIKSFDEYFDIESGKYKWNEIAKAIGTTDARAIGYFQTLEVGEGVIDNSSASIEGMSEYLKKSGQAFDFAAIKAGLLNAALNAGIMLAFSLAIKAVTEAWDEYNYTVEESQQNIDEINDKIKDLTQQLDELNSIEDKSQYDKKKIGYLQQELDLQERLLEIEQKRYYQNLIGTSFSDNFDKDSLVSKQGAEYNHNNKNNLENLTRRATNYIDDVELYNQKIIEAEQNVKNGLMTQEDVNNIIKKRTDLLSDQENIEDQLLTNMAGYLENEKSAQEALDSGLLTGKDLEKAQEMVTYWHQMYVDSFGLLENVQKVSGTYDDTKDRLTLKFGKIDPNDFDNLTDEEKKIALTLEPDANIDFDELKSKIEEKLNNPPINVNIETSSISFGLNSDNVSTTMQGLEKIKSLYTQFAKAKEQLSSDSSTKLSFEIQDIEGIKDSLMDANKQLLVSEEEFSNFETILADQSSTAQQIQDAFDSLATAYVNNALEQGNYTDETKELIKTQLELQGATAESADAFVEQQVKISEAYKAIQDAGFTAINIPSEEITKMEQLGIVTAETAEQMRLLAIQEQIKNGTTLNTATDCQNLLALASDAGLTTEVISELVRLMEIYSGLESGVYGQGTEDRAKALTEATNIKNKIQDLILNGSNEIELDFSNVGGGSKSSGSAGKEAGDAYVEAYEKELEKLQTARDRGEITEAEYLSRMKALYEKYFGGISKYQDKYFEEQRKYLEGMESLYNSALSGITKLMGNKIDLYNEEKETVISNLQEEKDAAIDALEAQKKAAEEAYQAQIDAIQEKIDALEKEKKANQKIIDSIQDEIDAINDAADSRKRELTLMKAKYELEKMMSQRTKLVKIMPGIIVI